MTGTRPTKDRHDHRTVERHSFDLADFVVVRVGDKKTAVRGNGEAADTIERSGRRRSVRSAGDTSAGDRRDEATGDLADSVDRVVGDEDRAHRVDGNRSRHGEASGSDRSVEVAMHCSAGDRGDGPARGHLSDLASLRISNLDVADAINSNTGRVSEAGCGSLTVHRVLRAAARERRHDAFGRDLADLVVPGITDEDVAVLVDRSAAPGSPVPTGAANEGWESGRRTRMSALRV